MVKNPPGNAEDLKDVVSVAGSGRSTLVFLPLERYGQESLMGYSIESQRFEHDCSGLACT